MAEMFRLSREDLRSLATGQGQAGVVRLLRSAELSKHQILLAALMRDAERSRPADYAAVLVPAYRLLADVESRNREIVRDLLASPQFGGWVSDCGLRLSATAAGIADAAPGGAPLRTDLGQLAVIAATAAIRAGYPFELDIPLRQGAVTFPGLGTVYPGETQAWEWCRACLDERGSRVISTVSTVSVRPGSPEVTAGSWSSIVRLTADSDGLHFDVTLDDRDFFLDRYRTARAMVVAEDLDIWRELLERAWTILTENHREVAAMIANVVRTLVPLARPAPIRSTSSTAASCFGAIALSLPVDSLAMAETLVHEFQHGVLSAVMDLMPMTGPGDAFLTYAPWREDARPAGALLQGIYAHFGLARFWRLQRHVGSAAERLRGNVEFARWRMLVAEAAHRLATSGALTGYGNDLLSAIREVLAVWQSELVPPLAVGYAEDLSVDHRVRWRLRYLRPDRTAIDTLAVAWRAGGTSPKALEEVDVTLDPGSASAGVTRVRSYLLALRYRDPERFRKWMECGGSPDDDDSDRTRIDPADVALLAGAYSEAADGYLRRIAACEDADAWAGLAIARRHSGPAPVAVALAERAEVIMALYGRLRDDGADPEGLAAWLIQAAS